jgi:hypothetical protein
MLKAVGEKKQITYKGKPIKITADFSIETFNGVRSYGHYMKITTILGHSAQQNYHSK